MDTQSSWTKGLTQKSDKSAPQATYQNSFEFLDMSSCDETQKLKLKNTLEMPLLTTAASAPSRDRYRSNFITRSIKPQHYHLNNCVKTQRLNHQSNSSKFSNNLENHESISTRAFCPEGNNVINKINSNFSNQVSTNTNNRNFSNNQDRISKWHNKKPPVQIKEPDIITSKETLTKRACGEKERFFINHQPKEVTRDSGRTFNKKMSPPPTNFQTSTTSTSSSSSSNQGSMPHYQYGSHQQVYPQMYPHQMEHHINQNTSQQQQIRGGMGRRNGRSRGGNNRRDFQVRQHNHQQNQQANDYGQPLLDQNQQGAVMNSAQYQPIYIHYSPWQNTLPPQNLNLTQNLTGQPLFAIQQPLMYQYGSPYPFMYNMMPQAHSMPHHQSELVENDIQDPPPIPWAHSQPIYHHSPLLNNDFQNSSDGFEMVNSINEYHEEIDPEITFVDVDSEDTFEDKEENLVGKTRDLLIQTISPVENSVELSLLKTSDTSTENEKTQNVCETSLEFIEPESVPISSAQKKQTASVSVSAIPNKDANNSETKKIVNEILEPSISFSSITASKYPTAPLEHKKTENNQTEVQQTALIERAKQQIVTTIIGHKETDKNVEDSKMSSKEENTEQELFIYDKKAQTKPTTSNLPSPAASARATWAGLFDSKKSVSSPSSSSNNFVSTEPQKSFPLSNSEELSTQAPPVSSNGSQVPSTAMSYSAVSAQHITTTEAKQHSSVKSLPQNKKNLTIVDENSNNQNNVNVAPLDQRSLKLGDFFSSYKIESNSIAIRPRGLLNKSNYCYINAILQALVSCPPFYHLMKAIPQMPITYRSNNKTPVTDAMVELVSNYSLMPYRKWTPREKGKKDEVPDIARDTAFEPSVVLKMLQTLRTTEMFPVEGRQEDAEEFLSFILNRMNDEMIEMKKLVEKPKEAPGEEEKEDELNGNVEVIGNDDDEWQVISGTRNKSTITRTTDFGKSPISDIFGGKLKVRVHREGDHSSDNIEPFFTLKLVIEKASSVREALEILVGRDQLEGVLGRTNQEVAAWQQVTIEELPVVLILHLKCFDFKKDGCTKILKSVDFPIELKLDQKIVASKSKYQQKQKQYKLFAVVYHDGKEASKGHYITDVFHLSYSSWIRYDDSSVKAITESNVLHPKTPRVPYLLFYRRADTIGHTQSAKYQPNKI